MEFVKIFIFCILIFALTYGFSILVSLGFYLRGKRRIEKLPNQYHELISKFGYILVKREYKSKFKGTRWAINKKVDDRYSNIVTDIDSWTMYQKLQVCFENTYPGGRPCFDVEKMERIFLECTNPKSVTWEKW
ncbi:hypothetical protein HPMBJEAJ_00351 [Aeromonas phage avDM6]|nr:hypothetical protein HPMBJEAJ_00351 [Aeromonas phage avDM6]